MRRETFQFWDLVWLILEVWWYLCTYLPRHITVRPDRTLSLLHVWVQPTLCRGRPVLWRLCWGSCCLSWSAAAGSFARREQTTRVKKTYTLRAELNGQWHFSNAFSGMKISEFWLLMLVPKGEIDNKAALVQVMSWCHLDLVIGQIGCIIGAI